MRVVVSSGTRTWGGLEQMTVLLAEGLHARGHHVTAFCRDDSPVHERLKARIPCEPILAHGRLNPLTVGRCAGALRRHRAQVVIGNTTKDPAWTGAAARLVGVPYVYRHEFNRPYHDPPRTRLLFGQIPALHVVNSQASRATVLGSAPWLPTERVRVIPNGIDVEGAQAASPARLGLQEGAVVFGFVGRFEEQKGVFELAGAWPRVSAALPNAHLVLVGWGKLQPELRSRLAGAANVHWLGFREDVPSLMKAFDVLVAPFQREGFGLVLVEAMAVGVPVVAAHASSTPELMEDGVEGRMVPPRDADSLAAAMIELGSDPERRARMGARGRERAARDFSQARMISAHEELLAEVVGEDVTGAGATARASGEPRPSGRGSPRTESRA